MPTLHLITVGKLKTGPFRDAIDDYLKRMKWTVKIDEIDVRGAGSHQKEAENQAILSALPAPGTPVFVLDERGKTMTSPDFAATLQKLIDQGDHTLTFVIGGADGLNDEIRKRARHIISFGSFVWPHMMVRLMLVEQLYRAESILSGHPYHRV